MAFNIPFSKNDAIASLLVKAEGDAATDSPVLVVTDIFRIFKAYFSLSRSTLACFSVTVLQVLIGESRDSKST